MEVTMIKVTCTACDGTGLVDIPTRKAETLQILRKKRKPVIAARDYRVFGCEPRCLSNRLRWLAKRGLAIGTVHPKDSRLVEYVAVRKK